jgi:hypothetical protein
MEIESIPFKGLVCVLFGKVNNAIHDEPPLKNKKDRRSIVKRSVLPNLLDILILWS